MGKRAVILIKEHHLSHFFLRMLTGLIFLTGFLSGISAQAQTLNPALPIDSRKLFSIGITEFSGVNLSPENMYLKSSLPAQVKEKIIGIESHVYNDEEKEAYRKWILAAELQKVFTELEALSKKKDEDFFLSKKQFERDRITADYEKKRAELLARVNFYRTFEAGKIALPDEKNAEIQTDSGKLLASPSWSALEYSVKKDLDILVTGSIEEIQGYLYLELVVYHRILEKNIFYFRDAGTREDITGYLLTTVPKITTLLLGREWAGILIDVDPPFSYIKIDGKLVGMGTAERTFYIPGEVEIEIEAPGYLSFSKTVTLAPQASERLEITLERSYSDVFLVESIPPGAQVYLDSLWMGTAPLVMI
ncbi:MAG: PEGA domain-containing protein, partial [Spirochaetaceae bacterium]